MDSKQTARKRTGLVLALALCCLLAVGGVFAWFSTTTSKTNTFTQGGGITEPTEKPKPDPDGSGDGGTETITPDGNIVETEWVDETGIAPDSIVAKNPNIGIGKKSKSAYVFVEVENALDPANAYFVLGDKWAPVTDPDLTTAYNGDKDATIGPDKLARCYNKGLFVYVGTNNKNDIVQDMAMLTGKTDVSVYTGEVFDKIYTNKDFKFNGTNNTITVKAYLAAASNDTEDVTTVEIKNEILTKAKAWAKSN